MPRIFTCILLLAVIPGTVSAQGAVRGGKVYTMTGPAVEDGIVIVRDGKIAAIGRAICKITWPE